MNRNPILEEIYAIREKLLADAGGDMHKYIQEARARALASGRPLAESKQITTPRTGMANSNVRETETQSAAPAANPS